MPLIALNIGSNLGDRYANIEKAVALISEEFGIVCMSSFMESEPWGFHSANKFVNVGVSFNSDCHPEDLLRKLKKIESEVNINPHRDSEGRYSDREIDIDIMAIDEISYHSESLTVPHAHLLERDFFMLPLMQLMPEWKHPSRID